MGLNDPGLTNILLYPNPTSEILNISTELNNFKIEIFDLIGKKIFETTNSKLVNTDEFDNGIYLLKISHGMYSQSKLFIKK